MCLFIGSSERNSCMPSLLRTPRRRIVGLARLATAAAVTIFTVATLPAGAQSQTPLATSPVNCAVLQLGNPNPGDLLPQGDYVVSGMAFDPNASDNLWPPTRGRLAPWSGSTHDD